MDAQREYLMQKYDIADWSDEQIKQADTGTYIYVTANIKLQDSIEDLKFTLYI